MIKWILGAVGLSVIGCAQLPGPAPSTEQGSTLQQELLEEELDRLGKEEAKVPKSSIAHYYFVRGELALDDDRAEEALSFFEQAASYEKTPAPFLRRRLAQLYVRSGNLEKALAELDKALSESPDDLDLLRLKGGILSSVQRVDEAIAVYRKLISLNAKDQDAYVILSSLYAQQRDMVAAISVLRELVRQEPDSLFGYYYLARTLEAAGDLKEAEKNYRIATTIDPGSEAVHVDFARALAMQGRKDQAIAVLRKILKSNPKSVAGMQLLGQLLWEGKKLEEALSTLENLLDIEDDPLETRLKIALIKLERKDYDAAEQELRLILAAYPNNSMARYFLASVYASQAKSKEAIAELKEIPSDDKMYVESKTLAAHLLRQNKQFDDAAQEIESALEAKENDTGLLAYLATVQREGEDYDGAIRTMEKILELEPSDDNHYFTLGVLYHDKGDEEKSLTLMRKAIELNPNNANALNYLGYTLGERGEQLDEALSLVNRALAIDPKNGYFLDSLGWIYFKLGRNSDALAQLESAVKLTPEDSVILEHLAEVLLKVGRRAEAIKIFERALEFAPQSDDKEAEQRIRQRLVDVNSNG